MFKKLLAGLVAAPALFASSAMAQSVSILPETGTFEVGEVITVTLGIDTFWESAGDGIRGGGFGVEFDESLLELVSPDDPFTKVPENESEQANPFNQSLIVSPTLPGGEEGYVEIAYQTNNFVRANYAGPAFTIQFTVLDEAEASELNFRTTTTQFAGGATPATELERNGAVYSFIEATVEPDPSNLVVTFEDTPVASGGSVDFGTFEEGTGDLTRTFSLSNTGGESITFSGFEATGDFSISGSTPESLEPGASSTVSVSFSTDDPGDLVGDLTISSNAANAATYTANLSATVDAVVPPGPGVVAIEIDGNPISLPGNFDFGTFVQNDSPLSATFTIRNTGESAIEFESIEVSGTGFTQTNVVETGPLAPGATRNVVIQAETNAVGEFSGVLQIASDAENSPVTVALTSTVEAPAPTTASLRATHLSPDAPSVDVLANNETIFNALTFPSGTVTIEVDPGSYDVAIILEDDVESVVADAELDLEAGLFYNVVAFDNADALQLLPLVEDRSSTNPGAIRVTAIHTAVGVGTVDIYNVGDEENSILIGALDFGAASPAAEIPAGSYVLGLDVDQSGVIDFTFTLPEISAGAIVNVFAVTETDGTPFLFAQFADDSTARIDADAPSEPAPLLVVTANGTNVPNNGTVTLPPGALGDPEPTRTLTVTNQGDADLLFVSALLVEGQITISGSLPPVLAPGESAELTASRSTAVVGEFTGTLTLESNDPSNDSFVVNLESTIFDVTPPAPNVDLIAIDGLEDSRRAWLSSNIDGDFVEPALLGDTGYRHDPANGFVVLSGDFNGNQLSGLAHINDAGQLWIANITSSNQLSTPVLSGDGFTVDPDAGFRVVTGDFDGSGRTDFVQTTPADEVFIAFTEPGAVVGQPVFAGIIDGIGSALDVVVGDFNGDGFDDLLVVGQTGLTVALSDGLDFSAVEWTVPNFTFNQSAPNGRLAVRVGDFTGDGRADILQSEPDDQTIDGVLIPLSRTFVALSDGEGFQDASVWGQLGYHDHSARSAGTAGTGWFTFPGDVTGNGTDDLIQINEFGEVWYSLSNGFDGFVYVDGPNASIGFQHQADGPWQVFVGQAVELIPAR